MAATTLTTRMIEAVTWLSKDKTVPQAAKLMGLSKWTVQDNIREAKDIVGVSTSTALVGECFRKGIIR